MTRRANPYSVVPLPRFRRQMIDWLDLEHRKHATYILMDVDVTKARQDIREFRASTRTPLSMTAFLATCLARAIEENPLMHGYRKGRGRLVLFDDVDVTVPIERDIEDHKVPVPYIIRAANRKGFADIHREIAGAKTGVNPQSGALPWLPIWLLHPAFMRRLILRWLLSSPYRRKLMTGTTIVTNAGLFGSGSGWGINPPSHTTALIVGSIAKKPGVVEDQVKVREYMALTLGVDHDIVDGAVAARFAERLKVLIQSGGGLMDGGRDPAVSRTESVA